MKREDLQLRDHAPYESAMRAALREAQLAGENGELPYGAVICGPDREIVARSQDQVERHGDPTRHGEFEVVRLAIEARGRDLSGHFLVSTVEPCCMCSAAAWYAGISTAAFGLTMAELKALCPEALEEPLGPIEEVFAGCHRGLNAVPGVLREECLDLWTAFATR